MPSPQMQEVINRLRQRRATPSSQPPQTYEEILGPYSLANQVNPLPADVSVTDLISDSERLASAAAEAGVDITLHVGEGLPHVYQAAVATPEAVSAMRQIADFIRRL